MLLFLFAYGPEFVLKLHCFVSCWTKNKSFYRFCSVFAYELMYLICFFFLWNNDSLQLKNKETFCFNFSRMVINFYFEEQNFCISRSFANLKGCHTGRQQIYRYTYKQTGMQADVQAGRQTYSHTDRCRRCPPNTGWASVAPGGTSTSPGWASTQIRGASIAPGWAP
jgi:hypothetical protein